MTEKPVGPPAERGRRFRFPTSLKNVGEWLNSVWSLQRSVESQKAKITRLDEQVDRLQRQVDDQAGQLRY